MNTQQHINKRQLDELIEQLVTCNDLIQRNAEIMHDLGYSVQDGRVTDADFQRWQFALADAITAQTVTAQQLIERLAAMGLSPPAHAHNGAVVKLVPDDDVPGGLGSITVEGTAKRPPCVRQPRHPPHPSLARKHSPSAAPGEPAPALSALLTDRASSDRSD